MSHHEETDVREYLRIHDFNHPESELNKLEMIYVAGLRSLPECPHCRVDYRVVPMHGTAWGIEHFHDDDCPDGEGR